MSSLTERMARRPSSSRVIVAIAVRGKTHQWASPVEYGLMIVLIAVVVIVAFTALGPNLSVALQSVATTV